MSVINIKLKVKNIENQIIKWRRDLHQIPELGFETKETKNYIEGVLKNLNIEYESGIAKNGIVAKLLKDKPDNYKTFAIRADIDGLPVKEETGLNYKSKNEGKMHACGHDAHIAMALGAAKILKNNFNLINGNIKLIFQPGEEGYGGAKKMINEGVLKNPDVDAIIGLHIGSLFPELDNGQVGIKKGATMASFDNFKLTVKGKGGHGAIPNETIDPIAISASIIESMQTLISRELSPVHPGVISVCKINGGTAHNIIPEKIEMEGTARFINEKDRDFISKRMCELSENIANSRRANVDFEYNYGYPSLINPEGFVDFFKKSALEVLDENQIIELKNPVMGGEDMAYFLNEIPGLFFFLGSKKEVDNKFYSHHNSKFDIDESVLWIGTTLFVKAALDWLN